MKSQLPMMSPTATYRPSYMVVTTQPDVASIQEQLVMKSVMFTWGEYSKNQLVHCFKSKPTLISIEQFLMLAITGKFGNADQFVPVWLNLSDCKYDAARTNELILTDLRRTVLLVLESEEVRNIYKARVREVFKA